MATTNTLPAVPSVFSGSSQSTFFIQNLGTNPLYVKWGASASVTDFNVVLAAGGVASDGTGGTHSQNYYFGTISVAGTSPNYIAYYIINGAVAQ